MTASTKGSIKNRQQRIKTHNLRLVSFLKVKQKMKQINSKNLLPSSFLIFFFTSFHLCKQRMQTNSVDKFLLYFPTLWWPRGAIVKFENKN